MAQEGTEVPMAREFSAIGPHSPGGESNEEESNGRSLTKKSNGKTAFKKITRSKSQISRATNATIFDPVLIPLANKFRGPHWLSGNLETAEEKTYTIWERNYIFIRVMRMAVVISLGSMGVFYVRRYVYSNSKLERIFLTSLFETFREPFSENSKIFVVRFEEI